VIVWLCANWGNIASILSLVVSILGLLAARGARAAAQQARLAIRRRTLVEELRAIERNFVFLRLSCEQGTWDVARHAATEAGQLVVFVQNRWSSLFDAHSMERLEVASVQLETISQQIDLHARGKAKESDRRSLLDSIRAVSQEIAAELGKYESQQDQREDGGGHEGRT